MFRTAFEGKWWSTFAQCDFFLNGMLFFMEVSGKPNSWTEESYKYQVAQQFHIGCGCGWDFRKGLGFNPPPPVARLNTVVGFKREVATEIP